MEIKHKYVLGFEYFVVDGWTVSKKIKITGVQSVNEKIKYLYGSHSTKTVLESDLFTTLEQAKNQCLLNIVNDTDEIKKEVAGLKEEDFARVNNDS